jgi:hypothetical protein
MTELNPLQKLLVALVNSTKYEFQKNEKILLSKSTIMGNRANFKDSQNQLFEGFERFTTIESENIGDLINAAFDFTNNAKSLNKLRITENQNQKELIGETSAYMSSIFEAFVWITQEDHHVNQYSHLVNHMHSNLLKLLPESDEIGELKELGECLFNKAFVGDSSGRKHRAFYLIPSDKQNEFVNNFEKIFTIIPSLHAQILSKTDIEYRIYYLRCDIKQILEDLNPSEEEKLVIQELINKTESILTKIKELPQNIVLTIEELIEELIEENPGLLDNPLSDDFGQSESTLSDSEISDRLQQMLCIEGGKYVSDLLNQ